MPPFFYCSIKKQIGSIIVNLIPPGPPSITNANKDLCISPSSQHSIEKVQFYTQIFLYISQCLFILNTDSQEWFLTKTHFLT